MELQCPSLEYVYSMTWAEFRIRAHAFKRMEEVKDLRAREVAWSALIAPNANPKKLPKNKNSFWQIGFKEKVITDRMKEAIEKAQKQYLIDKEKAENGIR